MKNNKGMSLFEIVVAMAILSLVLGMILSMVLASTNHYKAAGAEVDIQYEVQTAANQVQDLLLNAGTGIRYRVDGREAVQDSECPNGGADAVQKEVCTYRIEEENQADGTSLKRIIAEKIIWEKAEERMYYSKYYVKKNADNSYVYQPIEENCLLTEYITYFSADLSKAEEHSQAVISLAFQREGKTFHMEKEIALRNLVKINVSEEELDSE